MSIVPSLTALSLAALLAAATAAAAPGSDPLGSGTPSEPGDDRPRAAAPRVEMVTAAGRLVFELDAERAPVTVANFLAYVDRGLYDGAAFYRTVTPDNQPDSPVKIEVIQGGLGFEEQPGALPPIRHESTEETGLAHLDGVVSMARAAPGTATSELFICVGDQPELDFGGRRNPDGQGFAAFGRVVEGIDVVRAIHRRPARGQRLDPPVAILRVRRLP